MKKFGLFIFCCIISIGLNAQYLQLPCHSTLPGEKPGLKLITHDADKGMTSFTKQKNTSNCIDTLYKVRFSNVFTDVNDWDSAYFISGYTNNERHYYYDSINPTLLTTLKVDYSGKVLWVRTDSVMSGDHFSIYNTSLIRLSDGNYLQAGVVRNDYKHPRNYDWKVSVYTKFDTDGHTIWQKTYRDTAYMKSGDWPQSVLAEPDGGFTVAALVASDTKIYSLDTTIDYWYVDTTYVGFIRFDSTGTMVNRQRYFIGGEPINRSIGLLMKEPDGGYLLGGTNKFQSGQAPLNYYILKVDSNFTWQWRKLFSQTVNNVSLMEILPLSDMRKYFAVRHADTPVIYDAYNNLWYSNYYQIGLMDNNYNIVTDTMFRLFLGNIPDPLFDRGFIQGATMTKNYDKITVLSGLGGMGANMISLDTNFHFNWNRWIADFPYFTEDPYRMRRAHDGGYLIVGLSERAGVGGWFVKTDTNGFALPNQGDTLFHIGVSEYAPPETGEVLLFPNPFSNQAELSFEQGVFNEFQLIDILGNVVYKSPIEYSSSSITIHRNGMARGFYLGRLLGNTNKQAIIKIVIN